MNGTRRRSGQALVMMTCALFLMLGVIGLGVDMGWAYYQRESAQTAADAAAAAVIRAAKASSPTSQACGASKVWCGSPAGTVTNCPATAPTTASTSFDNGCMLASANGFTTTGSKTVSIQANTTSPAPTVSGTTVNYWATVRVSVTSTRFFGMLSGPALATSARATSGITLTGLSTTNPCIYILSTSSTATTFTMANGVSITTSSCGVYVNGSYSQALSVTGGAALHSATVKVVGNYVANNGGTIAPATVQTGVTAAADPFLSLPAPTVTTPCTSVNYTAYQATAYTPGPGTYCGMSVSNGNSVVLSSGTYVISGGNLSVAGGSTFTGTAGVMIYLTNGATVSFSNNAAVSMSPQTSGTYQGVLFYQDRTMTSPAASSFTGGSSMHLNGSLYLPHSLINLDNGSNSQMQALVVGSLNVQGGATLQQPTSWSSTGLNPYGGPAVSVIE